MSSAENFKALRESFDRVLLPLPLIDIRWIGKRDCLRRFCASGPAIVEYMNGKDKLTPEEESVVEAVENHMHEFQAVLFSRYWMCWAHLRYKCKREALTCSLRNPLLQDVLQDFNH